MDLQLLLTSIIAFCATFTALGLMFNILLGPIKNQIYDQIPKQIKELREDTKNQITELREDTKNQITGLREDTKNQITDLKESHAKLNLKLDKILVSLSSRSS